MLQLTGTCNQTCSSLVVDDTTITVNSTIAVNLTVTVNTSPEDVGTFILHKDGSPLNRPNINHTSLSLPQVTYYIHNAQPMDSGVYNAEYSSTHATLFTNNVFIRVIEINTTVTTTSPDPTSHGKYLYTS